VLHNSNLLDDYVTALELQRVDKETIDLLIPIVKIWIETVRRNPNRLSGEEIKLVTMAQVEKIFSRHLETLWGMVIDPEQGYGRIGLNMRPMLL
jgi:hypothetical protein